MWDQIETFCLAYPVMLLPLHFRGYNDYTKEDARLLKYKTP
jgi:hypothetical protein